MGKKKNGGAKAADVDTDKKEETTEEKPSFGTLYKAARAADDAKNATLVDLKAKAEEAKGKASESLAELAKHYGQGPWVIDGDTVGLMHREGRYHFRGKTKRDIPEMSIDD